MLHSCLQIAMLLCGVNIEQADFAAAAKRRGGDGDDGPACVMPGVCVCVCQQRADAIGAVGPPG